MLLVLLLLFLFNTGAAIDPRRLADERVVVFLQMAGRHITWQKESSGGVPLVAVLGDPALERLLSARSRNGAGGFTVVPYNGALTGRLHMVVVGQDAPEPALERLYAEAQAGGILLIGTRTFPGLVPSIELKPEQGRLKILFDPRRLQAAGITPGDVLLRLLPPAAG